MSIPNKAILMSSKFQGALLGSLLGNCLGAPFIGETIVSKVVLQSYFDKLCGPYFPAPLKQYSHGTAMSRCVAESLIERKGFDAVDIAKRFVKESVEKPRRGYGANTSQVLQKLRASRFTDVYAPAREQFGGMGSFGNGGAMRVAPVALYFHRHKDGQQAMLEIAHNSTLITHTNRDAYNGAALQCLAVAQCLGLDPQQPLDVNAFIEDLKTKMSKIEKDEEGLGLEDSSTYQDALSKVKNLLDKPVVLNEQIKVDIGNDISALHSVPTAIFCFLYSHKHKDLEDIKTNDATRKTLQYAISIGGATDTIPSMAGALVGAYHGSHKINENILKHCEGSNEIANIAHKIFEISAT